jgi:uncharacterized protein
MLPFVTSVALAVTVDEIPDPRAQGVWVTDLGFVLPADSEARLNARIDALHRDLDAEIAVVVVPSIDGEVPKTFATALFNHWGIGDARTNNGLLVLLVLDQRRLEMETGYGLERVLPDDWLAEMQAERMVPALRDGDYGAALEAGLLAVDERMRPNEVPVLRMMYGAAAVGTGLAGLSLLTIASLVLLRRRERTCEQCKVYMPVLDDASAHLDSGQQTETRIGSIDWRVHQCPRCQAVRAFPKLRRLSGYTPCRTCGHRTLQTTTTTEIQATGYSCGTDRITERCRHCATGTSYTRTSPMIPATILVATDTSSSSSIDTSSSSSSSSFGGGDSGGGGAGSSY